MLIDGPKTAEDLAALTATHAPSLFRVLRALVSVEILASPEPGKERTGLEFDKLLTASFRLLRIIPTELPTAIIEA